ncbi:MAG: lysyl-tRNA synthetase, class, partial [Gaiellales bacterium]|nr:lysyl-tRNA synthetase, class [Gaiellales bacterium]
MSESRRLDHLPHRFADRSEIADVRAAHGDLDPGAASGARYRLAGRVMGRRLMGKAAFLDLEDRSDRVQLLASADGIGDELFAAVSDTQIGDIVGVEGEAIASRRGELTLQLGAFELLAPCEHPLPDLHHGLADVEARYRRRYVDLMVNRDVREDVLRRARMISAGREYLDAAGFVEVETPILQPLYGGASARPFETHHNELDRKLYLRIATELYLKRLIVGGLERVYEIGKNFRNEGVSFKHNPEFTVIEWYEAYADYTDGMRRTEEFTAASVRGALGTTVVTRDGREVDMAPPWPRKPLAEAIREACGVDVMALRDPAELRAALVERGAAAAQGDAGWAQLVDRALSHFVEPSIVEPVFLTDYPTELSPLARPFAGDPSLVERYEAFCCGMEFANGYSELNDPELQLARFQEQVAMREAG